MLRSFLPTSPAPPADRAASPRATLRALPAKAPPAPAMNKPKKSLPLPQPTIPMTRKNAAPATALPSCAAPAASPSFYPKLKDNNYAPNHHTVLRRRARLRVQASHYRRQNHHRVSPRPVYLQLDGHHHQGAPASARAQSRQKIL